MAMMRIVRRTLLLTAVALAVAAPLGFAASEAVKVNVPAAGLSLALPPSWKVVNAKTVTSAASQALAEENPQLAAIFAELNRPGTGVAFFAFDPVGGDHVRDERQHRHLSAAGRGDNRPVQGRRGA